MMRQLDSLKASSTQVCWNSRIAFGISIFLLASCLSCLSAQTAPDLPKPVIDSVSNLVESKMTEARIPGLSIAIVTDLQLRWAAGFGVADLENNVPASKETAYRLASIDKTIIATAIMQLAEAGKLDLDAPIQRYVPAFPQKPWPVTARQLLTHTGGIRTYQGDEMNSTRFYASLTEALNVFKDDPLAYQPGTDYLYSSQGYTILAVAIEGASGMNYWDYARSHIFEPAHMDHTQPDRVATIIPHRTQGYKKLANGQLVNSSLADTSNKAVASSTAVDLANFAIELLSGKLLKPETLKQMFAVDPVTERLTNSNDFMGYCFAGNVIRSEGKQDLQVYKAGNQQRVTGLLYMRPEKKFVIVLLGNLEDAPLTVRLARQISDLALSGSAPVK
jgi:CubicO group peptidase (beta-lactamase class C family)